MNSLSLIAFYHYIYVLIRPFTFRDTPWTTFYVSQKIFNNKKGRKTSVSEGFLPPLVNIDDRVMVVQFCIFPDSPLSMYMYLVSLNYLKYF